MLEIPDVMSVTDLRQDAASALERVPATGQPLVITQQGRAAAVMLSVEAYERGDWERQFLRLIARGGWEIAAGQGFDMKELLEAADALLSRAPLSGRKR